MAKNGLLDFTAIRRDTDFQSVLTHYGLMPDQTGPQLKLNCPFHDDGNPSCSVNLEKDIFRCFGCPAKGNVLDFIAQMEKYPEPATFKSAQKALTIMGLNASDYRKGSDGASANNGLQTRQNGRRATKSGKMTRTPAEPAKTASGAQREPEEGDPARTENPVLDLRLTLDPEHDYLADRGIDRELAETFGMGYCAKGIMKHRIAIPLHNPDGELVAFSGRWANGDDSIPEKEGKYKMPKGYEKSLDVFNLHRAKALGKKYVVVVEGIWSTVRLHAEGIPTVALLGTSLTDTQAGHIADAGFKHAIVILDGDNAGRVARPEVLEVLSQHVYVKTIDLEEGVKPDTMDDEIVDRLRR